MNWLEERMKQVVEERARQEQDARDSDTEYRAKMNYQKDYNQIKAKVEELEDELKRHYSPAGIDKMVKKALEHLEHKLRNQYEDEAEKLKRQIDYNKKIMQQCIDDAEKDGITIKRSESNDDLEYRALKTEEDYQDEYDELKDKATKLDKEVIRLTKKMDRVDYDSSEYKKLEKEMYKLSDESEDLHKQAKKIANEAKSKGFKIDVYR